MMREELPLPDKEIEPTLVCHLPVQFASSDGGVVIRRGGTQVFVKGEGIRPVLELIFALAAAGGATHSELDALIATRVPSLAGEPIRNLIDMLVFQRLLSAVADPAEATEAVEFGPLEMLQWELGLAASPQDRRISVVGNNLLSARITASLAANGVAVTHRVGDPALDDGRDGADDGWQDAESFIAAVEACDLLIAATPHGNQTALRSWNAFAVEHGIPFLPVVLIDNHGQIGPLVIPGDGPCLECLRARQNAAAEDPRLARAVESNAHLTPGAMATLNSSALLIAELAALEIVKHLLSARTFETVGQLLQCDFLKPTIERKRVLKVPRCRTCSPTARISAIRLSKSIPIPAEQAE